MESDHRYYSRRAAEENTRARHAVTDAARNRHLELATIFSRKAEQLTLSNVVVATLRDLSHRAPAMLMANGAAGED